MVNIKRIFTAGVLAAFCLMTSASAAANITVSDFDNNAKASIKGVSTGGNKYITLNIYAPGKTPEDADAVLEDNVPREMSEIVAYCAHATSDQNGEFVFNFALSGASGLYKGYLYDSSADDVADIDIYFSNPAEFSAAASLLNGAGNEGEVKSIIENNLITLGFHFPLYDMVSKEALAKLIYDHISKTPFDTSDLEKTRSEYRQLLIAQAFNENLITDFGAYAPYIDIIAVGELSRWYNSANMTAAVKSGVLRRISRRKITSIADLEEKLIEAFVLEIVKNHNGYDNAKAIITQFAEKIGVNAASISDAAYYSAAGGDYDDYASLRLALKTEKPGPSSAPTDGGRASFGEKVIAKQASQPVELPKPAVFADISEAQWAAEAIEALADRKIVSGKGDDRFYPNERITREEFVAMIVNLFTLTETDGEIRFEDVNVEDWFYGHVKAAYQNNIIKGISDDLFGSGQYITRQDMAVIIYNVIQIRGLNISADRGPLVFADSADISEYAESSVDFMSSARIINGYADNTFAPRGLATRAEAAQIIYTLLKKAGL